MIVCQFPIAQQCSAVQCSAVQYSAVQCSAVQCSVVECSAVQCSAVQCSAVQCSAVQCSAVPEIRFYTAVRACNTGGVASQSKGVLGRTQLAIIKVKFSIFNVYCTVLYFTQFHFDTQLVLNLLSLIDTKYAVYLV